VLFSLAAGVGLARPRAQAAGLRRRRTAAGGCARLLAPAAWRIAVIRDTRVLPTPDTHRALATAGEARAGRRPLDATAVR